MDFKCKALLVKKLLLQLFVNTTGNKPTKPISNKSKERDLKLDSSDGLYNFVNILKIPGWKKKERKEERKEEGEGGRRGGRREKTQKVFCFCF